MQLVAYLDGSRIDATTMSHEHWRALKDQPGYKDMVLPQCGIRAVRITSHKQTQYFAHYRNAHCEVRHKSETMQHLAMKRAIAETINALPGWIAAVEYAEDDRDWIADVMALGPDGRRVAFEVQLSQQTEEDYARRTQRYFENRIGPVWLVPRPLAHVSLQIPLIVAGFGKSSDLPDQPAALLEYETYQPLTREVSAVGTLVNLVLSPRFSWPHGSPAYQMQAREQALREAETEQTLRQQRQADVMAAKQRQAEENRRRTEADTAAFIGHARPAATAGSGKVNNHGRSYIWASIVRCRRYAHPVLVWQAQGTKELKVQPEDKPQRREAHEDVQMRLDGWLRTAGAARIKALLIRSKGWPARYGFACPTCRDIIGQHFIAALPPEKWSLVAIPAEKKPDFVSARIALQQRGTRSTPVVSQAEQPAPPRPPIVRESDQDFIGPKRFPLWKNEVRNAAELDHRQKAKTQREAEKQAIRVNPQYKDHGNDLRFTCKACGQDFENYDDTLHRYARCTGGQSPSK